MDTYERNASRMLAVAFNAYMEAMHSRDDGAMVRWAKRLLEAQRGTGIELLDPLTLLYPLTGEESAIKTTIAIVRASDPGPMARVTPEDGYGGPSKSGVVAGAPAPRKPSPGAANDIGARAAAFMVR